MSAGAFTPTKYETNSGEILKIRVQPETLAFQIGSTTNSAPTGSVTVPGSARASGGRRNGVRARAVYISFDDNAPTGYKDYTIYPIPCLRPAIYDAAETATSGTYLGASVRIVGRRPESIR